jgi:peroxiredoxin
MALTVGTTAPDFTLTSITDEGPVLVSLKKLLADGPVVLLFFPMAFTGGCTQEFCELSEGLAEYEKLNAQVLGISGDNPFAQAEWAQKEGIKVQLISDYEHDIAKAYGVAYETFLPEKNLNMGGVAKRSAFVIDRGGVIQYAEAQEDPHNMPNFDLIKEKLGQLS